MKFGRFLITFFKPLVKLIFPFKIIGKEHIPTAGDGVPVLLCANHISIIDPVFLEMGQKRHVFFMAKAELFPNKLAVWFFQKQLGAFPVKRGKGDSGAIDSSVQIIQEGKMMGIFPEGHRSKDGSLGRAKTGAALIAARSGAYVLPVAIQSANQKVRLFHRTKIIFGKPLSPAELHLEDPDHPDLRFASRRIMERIAELMEENR